MSDRFRGLRETLSQQHIRGVLNESEVKTLQDALTAHAKVEVLERAIRDNCELYDTAAEERDALKVERDELQRKGENLCCAYGNDLVKMADLTNEIEALKANLLVAEGTIERIRNGQPDWPSVMGRILIYDRERAK